MWSMKWMVPDQEVDRTGPGRGSKLIREDAIDRSRWRKLIDVG